MPTIATLRGSDRPRPSVRSLVLSVAAFVIAAATGLGSAYLAVRDMPPVGGIAVGPWMTWPSFGTRDIDPYARAVVARTGALPLGLGEGLTFMARTDDAQAPLEARCTYRLAGAVPPARAWTLTVYDEDGRLQPNAAERNALTSGALLRDGAGEAAITLSREAAPGNWLPLPADGRFTLVLRLYDTPVSAASTALEARLLPSITRGDCP